MATMTNTTELLEQSLSSFMSSLAPDLATLRELAPRFASLFTETALSVLVLEYILRAKGVIDDAEMESAINVAKEAVRRCGRRGGIVPAGSA
jgi:hypothetical protein